jgi:hypothetical protein
VVAAVVVEGVVVVAMVEEEEEVVVVEDVPSMAVEVLWEVREVPPWAPVVNPWPVPGRQRWP